MASSLDLARRDLPLIACEQAGITPNDIDALMEAARAGIEAATCD